MVTKPTIVVLASELAEAGRYLAHGYRVMLFIDADVLYSGSQDDMLSAALSRRRRRRVRRRRKT